MRHLRHLLYRLPVHHQDCRRGETSLSGPRLASPRIPHRIRKASRFRPRSALAFVDGTMAMRRTGPQPSERPLSVHRPIFASTENNFRFLRQVAHLMPEPPSPAILFHPEAYETTRKDLMGRPVASRGFLQGLIRYGGLPMLHGYMPQAGFGTAFEQLARDLGASIPVRIIEGHRLDELAAIGTLVLLD